jgi:hypothetical protein
MVCVRFRPPSEVAGQAARCCGRPTATRALLEQDPAVARVGAVVNPILTGEQAEFQPPIGMPASARTRP